MEGLYRQVDGQIMGLALAPVLKSVRRSGCGREEEAKERVLLSVSVG